MARNYICNCRNWYDFYKLSMNNKNKKILWKEILSAGDFLNGKLPPHPNHPKGRNAYAHVALEIKNKYKKSYKEIQDEKLQEVIEYINFLKKNPF